MVYADYNYYKNTFFGKLSEDEFNQSITKACMIIDNNINTVLDEEIIQELPEKAQEQLKNTACALLDLTYDKQNNDNKKVSSISIDGVNKTFKVISDSEFKDKQHEILKSLPIELTRYL